MSSVPKIVIIGGGSVNWTPHIVKDMLLTPSLQNAEYVLYDINPAAARLTSRFIERVQRHLGTAAKITPTDNQRAAFKDANYFIITISTGGLDAMAHDLAIPEDYGIYHTVGDTSGPGGWARSLRNFGVFVDLARAINRYAPGAMVLNYTNPMTVLTGVLARLCKGPVIGLCHGLFENLDFLKEYYRLESEKLFVQYSGLNHFFWVTEIRARGKDLLADLRTKIQKKNFTELGYEFSKDPIGFYSRRALATELFRLTDTMPYLGDRHTCEFLSPFITNKRTMKEYGLIQTTIPQRRAIFQRGRQYILDTLKLSELPSDFRHRSRETAADIISAHYEGRTFIDVGNTPNTGQMPDLPRGLVVETPVRVGRKGCEPLNQKPLPLIVAGLLGPCAHVFQMTEQACFEGNKKLALQALRLDPTCAHLPTPKVFEMGSRLLYAHRRWITCFSSPQSLALGGK